MDTAVLADPAAEAPHGLAKHCNDADRRTGQDLAPFPLVPAGIRPHSVPETQRPALNSRLNPGAASGQDPNSLHATPE
jgi:hypothetical protein